MNVNIHTLYSKLDNFNNNINYKIKVYNKIGEGGYGIIYKLDNKYVIKIFKNSLYKNLKKNTKNIIPSNEENREITFFIDYMKTNKNNQNYFIDVKLIGYINSDFLYNKNINLKKSYFIIMPYCLPVHKLINKYKYNLIDENYKYNFVVELMWRLIQIQSYIINQYDYINYDLKLKNFMITNNELLIKNIINIDFSLIIKNNNEKYNFDYDYKVWPKCKNIQLNYTIPYTICIDGLIVLFGKKFIVNLNNNNYLEKIEILKGNPLIYNIFNKGLSLKINIEKFNHLLKNYFKKIKNMN